MQPPDMEGILQQLNPPGEAKLAHGVRFVDLDGLVAQVQPSGDLLVAVALRHETQHFGLAVRERRRRPARPLSLPRRKRRGEVMRQCGINVLLTGSRSSNRPQQLGVWALLEHIGRRPGSQQFFEEGLVRVSGQAHDRKTLAEAPSVCAWR